MSFNSEEKSGGGGAPLWMVTFADLMALMMTFFVLLYSFSSLDETKYKMIVQSMAQGFGAVLTAPTATVSPSFGPPSMMPSPLNQPMGRTTQGTGSGYAECTPSANVGQNSLIV